MRWSPLGILLETLEINREPHHPTQRPKMLWCCLRGHDRVYFGFVNEKPRWVIAWGAGCVKPVRSRCEAEIKMRLFIATELASRIQPPMQSPTGCHFWSFHPGSTSCQSSECFDIVEDQSSTTVELRSNKRTT
jgi:hypothetical protein